MFKRRTSRTSPVPSYYLRMARHWRMGGRSSDLIRQRLIRRGISWETTLDVITRLDQEDTESGAISISQWRTPQARPWLISYSVFVVMGVFLLLLDGVLSAGGTRCDLVGWSFLGVGLIGLLIYAISTLLVRFL